MHDLYTGSLVDRELDRVVAVGSSIQVEVSNARNAGPPRFEVQDRWGMIRVDPHWNLTRTYGTPLPLWPLQLRPGWQSTETTRCHTDDAAALAWQQIMKARAWQVLTVPAGRFTVLRYHNWINYIPSETSVTNAVREETLWLAPEIGRWVARETRGYHYDDASGTGQQIIEPGRRWELVEWT